ncbi:MAG: alpha/beta hydrolase [Cytophagales bacterium]|nr:alpha/beta hydrolase [Cytophagales bacterium]
MKKLRYTHIGFVLLIGVIFLLVWTSCFRKYTMNDSEIATHYAHKTNKPQFFTHIYKKYALHYASIGADTLPLLLLIHGAPGAWYSYMHLIDDTLLQKKFKIISIDRPGYGKSGYGKSVTSIEMQALIISALIDLHPCHLPIYIMGRSYGAPIAAQLALMHQDRLKGLYLLSGALDPEKEKFWWFSDFGKWAVIRWLLPRALNVATDEKFAHIKELKILSSKLKYLHAPTCVMYGGRDYIVDTANYSYVKKMLSNAPARYYFLPEVGHLVSNERPELVRKEILKDLGN